jgi:hypothetical protein
MGRRRYSQGSQHGACAGKCVREGGPIGERLDNGNAGSGRHLSDAFWPRADDGSETDARCPAHAQNALPETAGSTDHGHVMR